MITSTRFPSWPIWLIVVGTLLLAPAAIGIAFSVGLQGMRLSELLRQATVPLGALLIGVGGLLGGLLLSVGVISYVAVGSLSHERAVQGYGSLGTILACFGAAVIVANVLTIPYALVEGQRHPGQPLTLTPGGLVLSVVTLDGALLAVVFARIVRPGVLTWEQMGITLAELGDRVRLGLGVGVLAIVATAIVEAALRAFGVQQTQEEMFAGVRGADVGQFVGVLLAGAVIAPVCEEIFFRGYVFTAVRQRSGVPAAFLVSSLLFALAHLNLQAFLPILLIGIVFAFVYHRTGSLVPSMIAHSMNNALALSALYFASQ